MSEHASEGDSFDVFLAYNGADKVLAESIATALRHRGVTVWLDTEQIAPGRLFQEVIQDGIRSARTAAILIGQEGVSQWQTMELQALIGVCMKARKPVIPVLLPDVDRLPDDLLFLKQYSYVPFRSVDDEEALRLLQWGITGSRAERSAADHREYIERASVSRSHLLGGSNSSQSGAIDEDVPRTSSTTPEDPSAIGDPAGARAYLQRAEVRLSTLHRIAGVFLNGAGLLVLFPVLVTQIVSSMIYVLSFAPFFTWSKYVFLITILLVTMLPVYSLILLFKELVQFYYVTKHDEKAGGDAVRFFPRFTLSGLALAPDERSDGKRAILAIQYSGRFTDFLIPRSSERRHYYSQVRTEYGAALPPLTGRTPSALAELLVRPHVSLGELETLGTALRMTGFDDRTLDEEVAKTEFSISRHLVYLRTLVIRYFKSLILLIISTLVLAVASGVMPRLTSGTKSPHFFPAQTEVSAVVLALLFLGWATLVAVGVRKPISWIYELADPSRDVFGSHQFDPALVLFERAVHNVALFVAALSIQTVLLYWWYWNELTLLDSPDFLYVAVAETALWLMLTFALSRSSLAEYRRDMGK